MSKEILCTAQTREELAECFANEIAKHYKCHLEFCQTTAMDDRDEVAMWDARIQTEPATVKERVLNRIKSVMANPTYYRRYFKKVWKVFVDWDVIRIVPSNGFFQKILVRDITGAFAVNVEYLINMREMNVVKVVHGQHESL